MRPKNEPTNISQLLQPALARLFDKVVNDRNKPVDIEKIKQGIAKINPN